MTESEKPKHCECVIEDELSMKNGKLWYFDLEYEVYTEFQVNYCPMCGQKVVRDG